MDQPVACSLGNDAVRDRVAAWGSTLAGLVTAVDWPSPEVVCMRLRDEPAGALVDLARLEVACCPFFEFGLEVTADGSVLTVAVPDEATPVLRDFAALASL